MSLERASGRCEGVGHRHTPFLTDLHVVDESHRHHIQAHLRANHRAEGILDGLSIWRRGRLLAVLRTWIARTPAPSSTRTAARAVGVAQVLHEPEKGDVQFSVHLCRLLRLENRDGLSDGYDQGAVHDDPLVEGERHVSGAGRGSPALRVIRTPSSPARTLRTSVALFERPSHREFRASFSCSSIHLFNKGANSAIHLPSGITVPPGLRMRTGWGLEHHFSNGFV